MARMPATPQIAFVLILFLSVVLRAPSGFRSRFPTLREWCYPDSAKEAVVFCRLTLGHLEG